jgi:hypothetical protein
MTMAAIRVKHLSAQTKGLDTNYIGLVGISIFGLEACLFGLRWIDAIDVGSSIALIELPR